MTEDTRTIRDPATVRPAGELFAGRYRIVREIGRGGMGVVFEAEQQSPKRPVALKIIRGAFVDETAVRMFQREAQTLARLRHPRIADIYESGCAPDGRHFFAMELVRGEPLDAYLKREDGAVRPGPEAIRRRIRLFLEICDAVSYAHQRGVIHRDLKPSNILVLPGAAGKREVPEVKVLDFGLARITDAEVAAGTFVTEAGRIYGTYPYMSPEQIRGDPDEIDLRTDVYALGVLLYEMLTGRLPYEIRTSAIHEAARIIVEEPPLALSRAWVGTRKPGSDLQTIVAKALEKEPGRRYQSASALSDDLERYLRDQPILARPPSAVYQLRKMIVRHKIGFAFAAGSVILLAAFAVTMTLLSARIARERTRAETEAAKAGAVKAFLLDTLGSANPIEGTGREVTVLEALKAAADKVSSAFAGQPRVVAEVRHSIAITYLRLGRYDEAEGLLRSALKILEAEAGPDAPDLVELRSALGILRDERGDYAEAESLQRSALDLARKLHGERSQEVVDVLNNLAQTLQDKGDLAGAEPLMRRVLEADRKNWGPEHGNVAGDLNNLGLILLKLGKLEEAEPMLRSSARLFEKLGDPWLFQAESNLGDLLTRKGDLGAAEPLLAGALAKALALMGEKNQDVAKARTKYAACLIRLKKYPEAEAQLLAALPVLEASLGAKDVWTRRVLQTFVDLYDAWARNDEAAEFRNRLARREAP